MMKHNGTELQSMTFNGQVVRSWVHNGVEVFCARRIVYSATLGYIQDNVPSHIIGIPFIDEEYITNDNPKLAYVMWYDKDSGNQVDYSKIVTPTDRALLSYKYVEIHYEYGIRITYHEYSEYDASGTCKVNGKIVGYCNYTYNRSDSGSGVLILPIDELGSNEIRAYVSTMDKKDRIYAGIGITQIILTNEKPAE